MRFLALAGTLALTGLAACSSGSGRAAFETGVGFGDYQSYLRERSRGGSAGIQAQSGGGGVPYSVPPETTSGRITPPAQMPAQAPSTLDAVPIRAMPPAPVAPIAAVPAPQSMRVPWPELVAPEADRLVGDQDASPGQDVLDVPMANVEAVVEPDGVLDDLWGNRCRLYEVARCSIWQLSRKAG